MLKQKDEENRRLMDEIARIKAGGHPPINPNNNSVSMMRKSGNFTLGNMGLKMGGIDQQFANNNNNSNNPFSVFLP